MNAVVIDANLSLAQALPLPYSESVARMMVYWKNGLTRLIVPSLWEYEVILGLRRACAVGIISSEMSRQLFNELLGMGLEVIAGEPERHLLALTLAERLEQAHAYDTQYLALAEQLGCEFWTADQRLVNRSAQLGLRYVHWVGEG